MAWFHLICCNVTVVMAHITVSVPVAKGHIDLRMKAEAERVTHGEKVDGHYLTYYLSQTKLPMKTIYSNVTELLLAGVDTVRTTPPSSSSSGFCCRSTNFKNPFVPCLFPDLQHNVLVLVWAVPSPWGAGLTPMRGAECNGGSKHTRGSRCGSHAAPEGHSQRSAQV